MQNETFLALLGIAVIYTTIHFFVIQFYKTWEQRNGYEKFLTIISIAFIVLAWIGSAAK